MMKTITKSLYDYSLSLKNGKQAEVYDGTDVKWVFTGGTALNRIFGAQFSVEETDQHIVQIQTMFERWTGSHGKRKSSASDLQRVPLIPIV